MSVPCLRELLRRAADGDADAFRAFYDATSAQAYRLALLLTGHPEPAGHLCRIAYLRAWRELSSYDAGVSPLAWLLALTHELDRELAAAA